MPDCTQLSVGRVAGETARSESEVKRSRLTSTLAPLSPGSATMEAEAATLAPQTEHTAPPSTAPEPATTSADQLQNGTTSAQDDADMADATHSAQADKDKDKEEPLPEGATEVVYVHNLNEKIKLPIMKQSLKVLFREYGRVLAVTAHANVRMRGQAFVTLDSKRAAANAVREVEKFPLYGKPMVRPPVSLSSLAHARLLTQATAPPATRICEDRVGCPRRQAAS